MERPASIVDNDPAVRALLARLLAVLDYEVVGAANGVDALESPDRVRESAGARSNQHPDAERPGACRGRRFSGVPVLCTRQGYADESAWIS